MKKFKKILTTITFIGILLLSKFAMTNPVTNPTSAAIQRNLQQQLLGGQLEYDKRRAQQNQNQNYTPRRPESWSAVVWNDRTGDYYYTQWYSAYSSGSVVNELKKQLKKETNVTANRNIKWKSSDKFNIVVMGRNTKTEKWEMYYDNYAPIFNRIRHGDKEEINAYTSQFEENVLNKCREKADKCQVILTIRF